MKKIILSVFVFCLLFTPFLITMAATTVGAYQTIPTTGTIDNILTTAMTIANWLFSFLLVAGVIGIIVAGYMFVTSSGDASKVKTARDVIIYSLVGIVIASLAIVLVNWVRDLITP